MCNEFLDLSNFQDLKRHFEEERARILEPQLEDFAVPRSYSPRSIFATNNVALRYIKHVGFDYDYTIAQYRPELQCLIYDLARDHLVSTMQYPDGVKDVPYDEDFAIRGLHYDTSNGLLMKLDSFRNIQLDTVHRGRRPVAAAEVVAEYRGTHISHNLMHNRLVALTDLFSMPQACLLANVMQYFGDNEIHAHARFLFDDVNQAVSQAHALLRPIVMEEPAKYLDSNPKIAETFDMLRSAGKSLFLLTNSPFDFVQVGMQHLLGPSWRSIFDLVIVDARKPSFFSADRPFKQYDLARGRPMWKEVQSLSSGQIYAHGNVDDMIRMTGWDSSDILYFGDHISADLSVPSRSHGWRTGLIIHELEEVIELTHSKEFHLRLVWQLTLQRIIRKAQHIPDDRKDVATIKVWKKERDNNNRALKSMFNRHFGSPFRTYHVPSYFASQIFRFADLYTSRLENILNYPPNYHFYPQRSFMPHEDVVRRHPDSTYKIGK